MALVLAAWLSVQNGCWVSARQKVEHVLASGDEAFASLPLSATNILYDQWGVLFTGGGYGKIEMSADDLASFIANSPALTAHNLKAEFSTNHQHLPNPESTYERMSQHEYYSKHKADPDWYNPTIRGKGRGYHCWPNLWLFIDQEKNTLWFYVSKG
jgi:hypothetical protein